MSYKISQSQTTSIQSHLRVSAEDSKTIAQQLEKSIDVL